MAAATVAVASVSHPHRRSLSSSCSARATTPLSSATASFTSSKTTSCTSSSSSSSFTSSYHSFLSSSISKKFTTSQSDTPPDGNSGEAVVVTVASRCIKYVRSSEELDKTSSLSPARHPTPPCLPSDKWLCPSSRIPLQVWRETRRNGAGLVNPHALCFMNAVLQALAYTPGFAEDLLEGRHSRHCPVAQSKKRAHSSLSRGKSREGGQPSQEGVSKGHTPRSDLHSSSSSSLSKDENISFSFCALCKLEDQIKNIHRQNGGCVENRFSACVRQFIWKRFRPGRQEDAHEFLRYLLDALIRSQSSSSLSSSSTGAAGGSKKEAPPEVWMTSYCGQLFGGWLQSSIRCSQCTYSSIRFDACLDVPVDLGGGRGGKGFDSMGGFKSKHEKKWMKKNKKLLKRIGEGDGSGRGNQGVYTLEKALQRFVEKEYLNGENCYNCPQCKRKQPATKQMQIHSPPRILVLPIKRFAVEAMMGGGGFFHSGLFGGSFLMKNHTALSFPCVLNLAPYMSVPHSPPPLSSSSLSSFLSSIEEKKGHVDTTEKSKGLQLMQKNADEENTKDVSEGETCSTRASSSSSLSPSLSPVSSSPSPSEACSSSSSCSPPLYQLYAVVTHSGASLTSGHYRCFVRAPAAGLLEASAAAVASPSSSALHVSSSSSWLMIDDEVVRLVSESMVMHRLQQEAYLLFYSRIPSSQQIHEMTQRRQGKSSRQPGGGGENQRHSGHHEEDEESVEEKEEESSSLDHTSDETDSNTSLPPSTTSSPSEQHDRDNMSDESSLLSEETSEDEDFSVSSPSCSLSDDDGDSSSENEEDEADDFFQRIFKHRMRDRKDRRRHLWQYLMHPERTESESVPRGFLSRKLRQHMKLFLGACRSRNVLSMKKRRFSMDGLMRPRKQEEESSVDDCSCPHLGVPTPEKNIDHEGDIPGTFRTSGSSSPSSCSPPRNASSSNSLKGKHVKALSEEKDKKKRKVDMNRRENMTTMVEQQETEAGKRAVEGEKESLRNFHVVTPEEMRERIAAARSYSRQFGPRGRAGSWSDSEDEEERKGDRNDDDDDKDSSFRRGDKDEKQRAFERLQELQQPKSAKRSRHDREYDRGKIKKVKRKEPKPTVGASVSHSPSSSSSSAAPLVVHQRAAFDQVLAEKLNKGRRFQPRLRGDGDKNKKKKKFFTKNGGGGGGKGGHKKHFTPPRGHFHASKSFKH
ncbi:ubiquitin carboxyl-terminal hydrolase [Cystoisospora suis]|uniref:ubiquitinyl hydrolase 1 n=1 Tax=Cystoisospora suis TaxID=483139 RepID=A0A2C6KNK3_9APIC|nr:ubiquitin carboxyl-terminal hydrolase [Cystoisospora suis]